MVLTCVAVLLCVDSRNGGVAGSSGSLPYEAEGAFDGSVTRDGGVTGFCGFDILGGGCCGGRNRWSFFGRVGHKLEILLFNEVTSAMISSFVPNWMSSSSSSF